MVDDEGNGQDKGGTPPAGTGDSGERTFTQVDVDRIIKERIGREQARYADYDVLKKAAEELEKRKIADLSEQDQLKKRIVDMEQAKADWDAQAKAREMEINEKLLRAEVRVLAVTMNFIDPDEAWKLADLSGATFGDDGKIDGIKKPLEALAKDKPHLLKVADGPGSPPNKPGKQTSTDVLEQAMEDARERFGIKDYSKQTGGKT